MSRRAKILKSPKLIEKERAKTIKITLTYLLCSTMVLVGIFFVLRIDSLQISKIDSNVAYSSQVTDKVNSIISGSYLYLFPKSNIWLYPKSEIKNALLGSFLSIDNLVIQANGLSTLDIKITERTPIAIACDGFNTEEDNSNCYLLDSNGLVYANFSKLSDGIFFKYFISNHPISSLVGQNLFGDKDEFIKLQNFVESIRRSGLNLTGLLVGDDGQYEMYAKNYDDSEMVIYFDDRIPFEKSAINLIAFIEDSKVKKNGNDGKINFESINLRFGNNIFYVAK